MIYVSRNTCLYFSMVQQSLVGQGLLIVEVSQPHSDTRLSVEILWTSDQLEAWNPSDIIRHSEEPDIHAKAVYETAVPKASGRRPTP